MKAAALALLLSASALAQSFPPIPPGTSPEMRKAIIQDRMKQMGAAAAYADTQRRIAAQEAARKAEAQRAIDAVRPATIKEMETDLPSFIGKPVILTGTLDVSDYYNYGYSGSASIAYAYVFRDETGRGNLYQFRSEGDGLRRQILDAKGALRARLVVEILKGIRHAEGEGVMAQIRAVLPPEEAPAK